MIKRLSFRLLATLSVTVFVFSASPLSADATTKVRKTSPKKISETAHTRKKISTLRHSRRPVRHARRHHYYEKFYTSSFSTDNTEGDQAMGEDPIVRAAAIEALGNMNGSIVAIDPDNGRVLAMVNQKLALSEGAQPCSTIKVAVGLAALSEGIITKDTMVTLGGRYKMNLTQALAHSNNTYFEQVGRRLGFEKVSYYAQQFGLGELAGYNIEGEHLGIFPTEELSNKLGGVGKMCSFGESISLTPLQLGAMVSAIANGGSLYYLQHPTSQEEVLNFHPKLKRTLDIGNYIPQMEEGMGGAVDYGTARRVLTSFSEEKIMGKTGTCSKEGTRFGWFASFANTQHGRIATVVFLRGGRPTFGPKAAEIAGHIYRNLYDHSFFAANVPTRDHPAGAIRGVSQ